MSATDEFITSLLKQLEAFGRLQFGPAVKAFWIHASELCPCCAKRKIDYLEYQGERALSLNGFMYRERGVLIGYMLCPVCAREVMRTSSKWQTKMHQDIERNLTAAYKSYLVDSTNA